MVFPKAFHYINHYEIAKLHAYALIKTWSITLIIILKRKKSCVHTDNARCSFEYMLSGVPQFLLSIVQ